MFYENRAKSTKRSDNNKPIEKNFRNDEQRKTVSSELYFSIFESQSSLLKNKSPLTESRRLRLLNKQIKKTQSNNFKLESRENTSELFENDKKKDKIQVLFQQIIDDQNEGIKSPIEMSSSNRKRGQKSINAFSLSEKMKRSIIIPNINKTDRFSNFYNAGTDGDLEKPYKFSPLDSKYQEILKLKKEIILLKKEISTLQNEKNSKFQFEKESSQNKEKLNENFNEKRVTLLKNQISKQQNYIKNLHKSLRLIKKFYRDMTSVLLLFKNLDVKYSEMLKFKDNFFLKRSKTTIRNEINDMKEIDENQKFESLQKIMHGTKNSETFEKFISNFNEAYEKVKSFERKNEELNRMFEITDAEIAKDFKEKSKRIKYNYLLKDFIGKYRKYFPIKTFFDILEPKDKDSIDNNLSKLIKLMTKIDEIFHQISTFKNFKDNDFFVSSSTPNLNQDNILNFANTLNERKKINLSLNYQQIYETESCLSILLKKISTMHLAISGSKEITTENLLDIQANLRINIEKLLNLGISLNEGDENLLNFFKNETEIQLGSSINTKKKNENDNSVPIRKKLLNTEHNCDNDFRKIFSYLQESMTDLEETFKNLDENSNKKLLNLKFYLLSLNQLFEQKKVTSFLKEIDLNMQTKRIDLINKGFESLKTQIFEKIKSFEEFFQHVNEKIMKLSQNFEMLFDEVDEENKKKILTLSKKVNNLFKFLISNMEKRLDNKDFTEMYVDTEGLQKEYQIRIKIIEDKWGSFMKKMQAISEKINEKLNIK